MPLRLCNAWADGLKPDEVLDYASWADAYFVLSRESSSEYGQFRTSRTPFIREILEELSPESPAEVCCLVKPTQQAGTTTALIFLCGMMDMHPGPARMMMPTDSMCHSFSKTKLSTCIDATEKIRDTIAPVKSRGSDNTIMRKEFKGGSLTLSGAQSGTAYRTESIKYFIIDDFDGCPREIVGEGDTGELADRRTGTFPGRKIFFNSTTTIKDTSNIEKIFKDSSQGYYNVACPNCGHFQYLVWGDKDSDYGIKFTKNSDNEIIDIWYECESCHEKFYEHQKQEMLESAKYIHKFPERSLIRGFRYNALFCPIGWINSWKYIAEKFLKAMEELKNGNSKKYITWLNTLMAEPYEDRGEHPEWEALRDRCEIYDPVPEEAHFITCGTDVHGGFLSVSVYAWGPGEQCWLLHYQEIIGDPMQEDVWDMHDMLLQKEWGRGMRIMSCGIDCGDGNTTQSVRNYCRFRAPIVFALRGSPVKNQPLLGIPRKQDVTWNGQKIEKGVEVWPVGVDAAKATLYGRLNLPKAGSGYIHFYKGVSDEFFKQLTAEELKTKYDKKGNIVQEWHNARGNKANHYGDCWNYAYAAAYRIGLPFLQEQKDAAPKPPPKKVEKKSGNTRERIANRRPKWLDR